MPAVVRSEPLAVEFTFSDSRQLSVKLYDLPSPTLMADLAVGLAGLAHPHGSVNSPGTADDYRTASRRLGQFAADDGFTGGAGALTRAQLVRFWMGATCRDESTTRRMLRSWDEQTGGLRPPVRDYLTGQLLNASPRRRDKPPLAPYSDSEWQRLLSCCQDTVDEARVQQTAAVASARPADNARPPDWSAGAALSLLMTNGPMSSKRVSAFMGTRSLSPAQYGVWSKASARLFPTLQVTFAYQLLLGMTSGVVADGLDQLGVEDLDWAGDSTILLDYVKGRTGPESVTLPKPAVRVLRSWLTYSAPLRPFAPEAIRSRLWIACWPRALGRIVVPKFDWATKRRWIAEQGLRSDDESALRIDRRRIRTTFESRRDKGAWTGRTTIDPNHSAQVEGDHYLSRPTPAQLDAVHAVIEDAQSDLVRKAVAPPVVTGDDAVAAAQALPQRVRGMELTDTVVAELVGGARDVFTAACADQLSGLHGPAGKPCPARPWVCLLCPLAVFTPRHAPNLLRLKAFFARQFRQMPLPQYIAVFGPYADRLDQDVLPRFAPAVLVSAAAHVSDSDDELPLRPEETTQ